MAKRVLLLGIPGVQKTAAANHLAASLREINHNFDVVNFERDFLRLTDSVRRASFLNSSFSVQCDKWSAGWKQLKASLDPSKNYILSMHGCYISKHYGARCVFNPGIIAEDFSPSVIFTLITDIYDAWSVTHSTACKMELKGDPSLSQLLMARRTELLVGDQIANATNSHKNLDVIEPNGKDSAVSQSLFLSVYHPLQTFTNAVTAPDGFRVGYLSFPITQPRELEAQGDNRAREEISRFVWDAYQLQHKKKNLVIQCPLTIDELPFMYSLQEQHSKKFKEEIERELANRRQDKNVSSSEYSDLDEETKEKIKEKINKKIQLEFNRDDARWSLKELFHDETLLSSQKNPLELFFADQFMEVKGLIKSDVTLRDYRLVDQADFLAVFNPIIDPTRTEMARSVAEEITRALNLEIPVFLFQDKKYDPNNYVLKQLKIAPDAGGTMENEARRQLIIPCNDKEELLSKITTGGVIP